MLAVLPQIVEEKLAALPARPGCYIFRDKQNRVLYVGKAKSLRARVRSYFQSGTSDTRAFIPALPRLIGDLDTVVTVSEKEAAILENSLIKEHRPRLNVKLRDDKEYLNLRLSPAQDWPRLELVRKPKPDGARYFGPYHSATAARRTLHLVEKQFQLRTCNDRELASRRRPCIQYQIKRCPAPCVYEVDRELYGQQVRAVDLFLSGRHDELTSELEERMKQASRDLNFEVAAIYRDQLDAVRKIREQQRVVVVSEGDQDVLGLYREGDLVELGVVYVRQGRVVEVASLSHARMEIPDDEIVATFLRDHYGEGGVGSTHIPDEILVPLLPEGADGVAEWLGDLRAELTGKKKARCQLLSPQRGTRKRLLEMAQEHARHAFDEKRRAAEDIDERLAQLQKRLRLPVVPRRIECCDISHLGGQDTVGSVVALKDGVPNKRGYKSYRVRTVGEGDDYGAMFEVLGRRFRRGLQARAAEAATREGALPENDGASEGFADPARVAEDSVSEAVVEPRESELSEAEALAELSVNDAEEPEARADASRTWELPDLFVVDGGRGQLAVALAAAQDLGLFDLPIVALAKEKETPLGEKLVDRVYLPGQKNPISLRPNSPELFLLARARDEAHRFANRGRMKVGKKRRLGSRLEEIPGIGPRTRQALLKALGTVEGVRQATDEALLAVPGITRRHVAALRAHFSTENEESSGVAPTESAPSAP